MIETQPIFSLPPNGMTPKVCLSKDQHYLDTYIASKRSNYTKLKVSQTLHYFYNFLIQTHPETNSILNVDAHQFREYFQSINEVPVRKASKDIYKQNLKAYIFWILMPLMSEGKLPKLNYEMIFSPRFFKFIESSLPKNESPFSREDVLDCLRFFYGRNYRDYTMFSLLAYSGMRVGGVTALKIEDIHLEDRYIITQEKPTGNSPGINTYFIPKKFQTDLKAYILEVTAKNPTQERLFPIEPKSVRHQLKKWRPSAHPHLFRDAINTRWFELGLEESLRALLLSQTPHFVNSIHYLKKYQTLEAKREIYDRYFPY